MKREKLKTIGTIFSLDFFLQTQLLCLRGTMLMSAFLFICNSLVRDPHCWISFVLWTQLLSLRKTMSMLTFSSIWNSLIRKHHCWKAFVLWTQLRRLRGTVPKKVLMYFIGVWKQQMLLGVSRMTALWSLSLVGLLADGAIG